MVGQAAPASPHSCHSICLIAALLLCAVKWCVCVCFFVKKTGSTAVAMLYANCYDALTAFWSRFHGDILPCLKSSCF